jgi:hypothetical protein
MSTDLPPLPPPGGTLVPPAMGVHGSEQYAHGWGSASLRAYAAAAVAVERERLCAAIKAADDKASEGDYMLDSDDCISVIRRGTWGQDQKEQA